MATFVHCGYENSDARFMASAGECYSSDKSPSSTEQLYLVSRILLSVSWSLNNEKLILSLEKTIPMFLVTGAE